MVEVSTEAGAAARAPPPEITATTADTAISTENPMPARCFGSVTVVLPG
jgi:hypothetical protein